MRSWIGSSHVCSQSPLLPQPQRLRHMSISWRTFLRSTNSSHSIYNNARRHTLHSNLASRLRAQPFQKFHTTDLFSATHRDAMRHAPRRNWQPVGSFQRFRRRFDNMHSDYLLFGILGINGAVFAAWSYVQMFQVCSPAFPSTSP